MLLSGIIIAEWHAGALSVLFAFVFICAFTSLSDGSEVVPFVMKTNTCQTAVNKDHENKSLIYTPKSNWRPNIQNDTHEDDMDAVGNGITYDPPMY